MDAWSVQILQMHGTGTPLGDPIEVGAALSALLREGGDRSAPLVLSAVKSSIGHTEAAAGLAGAIQLMGCLAQRAHTSILHLRNLNHHVANMLSGDTQSALWADLPRESSLLACGESASVGGVSAFAFQGTNAHALLCAPLESSNVSLSLIHI